jgi:REP element-mobilizing transposase RayT
MAQQLFAPTRTHWHITWGVYGARLHGSHRPTVDRAHNHRGEALIGRDAWRQRMTKSVMNFPPITLTGEQQSAIEFHLPVICERGRWTYRICAAEIDHVHLLCEIRSEIHGEKVRRLAKRWLGEALTEIWPIEEGATWWAEEGSNKAIHDEKYLNNVYNYILRQRKTPLSPSEPGRPDPGA